MKPERDLRIDFLRGLAILIVLIDHVERINQVRDVLRWMPISLGFSDAAEAFVFLSGCVFAKVNTYRYQQRGFGQVFRKALVRSSQIWLAFVLTTAAVLVMSHLSDAVNHSAFRSTDQTDNAVETLLATLSMTINFKFPVHNILVLYTVILPPMAVLFWVMRWNRWAGVFLSLIPYVLVQFQPEITWPVWSGWTFNPLAWQFLFAIGMVLGFRDDYSRWRTSVKVAAVVVATIVIGVSLVLIQMNANSSWLVDAARSDWLIDKSRMAPLRLIHFLSVALVLRAILTTPWKRAPFATQFVITLGQAPLGTYCLGVILTFGSVYVTQYPGTHWTTMLFIHFDNVILSVIWANATRSLRTRRMSAKNQKKVLA